MEAYDVPLRVEKLTKVFEATSFFDRSHVRFTSVDGISFELRKGEILGLLGPNGAGKTTTIHMLLGVMQPTSGSIAYFGEDFFRRRSHIMRKVAFASTYIRLLGRLTIFENLSFYGELYGINGAERVKRIEHFLKVFDLWRLKDRKASGLSAGEMMRAILAKAFLSHPRVVLLDEPTAALDPDVAIEVRHFILEQRKQHGVSLVFTSHNMSEVSEVCDRVLVLRNGKIIGQDTPEALAASVSKTGLYLVSAQKDEIALFALNHNLAVTVAADDEDGITIELDEKDIAPFLEALAMRHLSYSQIALKKPTLEEYFLEIAGSRKDI